MDKRQTFAASHIELCEAKSNDIYMTVTMRMFSTQPNSNRVAVTEAFIDNIVACEDKYRCIPLCADTRKLKNGDHRHLGHMLDKRTGTFLSEQIGAFSSFERVDDEYGASLIGEARVARRNRKVCDAVHDLFEAGNLNFSFEILVSEASDVNGITVIDMADGNELIGMAVVSIPAYPEAKALALVAEIERDNRETIMLEHALIEVSEVDFDTIRCWFFEALRCALGDTLWDHRIERVGIDCAILYCTRQGTTLKVDYVAGNEGVTIIDMYEVIYQRKEEGVNQTMEDMTKTQAQQGPAEVQLDMAMLKAELDQKDGEIAALKNTIETQTSALAELEALKAEVNALREEKAEAEISVKREELKKFAEAHQLDIAAESIAKAIENLDYAALMAESTAGTKDNKPVIAAHAWSSGIRAAAYGGLLDTEQ